MIKIKLPETLDDCEEIDCADCQFQYSTEYWLCRKMLDKAERQRAV